MVKHPVKLFEKVLEFSRYLVYIPVVTLLLSTFFIFVYTLRNYAFLGELGDVSETEVITKIISAIDLFLLGIVALMIAVSLYELYIRNKDTKINLPSALVVESLDELKRKLGKVIYLVLVITFFKYALEFDYKSVHELSLFALSILFISLSLYFSKKG